MALLSDVRDVMPLLCADSFLVSNTLLHSYAPLAVCISLRGDKYECDCDLLRGR